ncbi:MAG: uroporphyrinogen-III C-methyltransferase [Gammaproteobacteria bacterium]|nr:uroporphyrinogen-III C-methyltransferase [Gammaproteobacteria bacterium]
MVNAGKVYLVGAGPGDPELLTLKALRLIERAEVVVYDRLVSPEILSLIPDTTARIDVGKRPGAHPVPQKSINQILIKLAKSGQDVVRLKGGDPMIFGRGGEEVLELERHGIVVNTVPGITAAQGCAAALNLPMTHRGVARSLVYMTGHTLENRLPDMDWKQLGRASSTLVIYMGAEKISQIVERLIKAGMDATTPALAMCSATLHCQKHLSTTLAQLPHDIEKVKLDGPVLFMIGDTVALAGSNGVSRHVEQDMLAVAANA